VNDKQAAIVKSFSHGLAVVAGAGCGKTTTLVAKCRELLDRNPGARFCAVSFTEKSVRDLKESLTSKLKGVELSDHWVKTIHGLCASIIQEFPAAAGMQGGERILVEDEAGRLWQRSLDVLWSSSENPAISEALDRLLTQYKREPLEKLFSKLRSLQSFGVEEFIERSFHRQEVADLWFVFQSIDHRYRHSKNRDGALDFNDLELLAARALRSEVVKRYFQQRFDLVLVDEFQDTNPLQGSILEAFARPGLSNLCIVGDPKQSIYRFRDADVTVFRDLTARLPGKHLLDENYRSRPDIIDFVNRACEPAFQASALDYEPLIPKREAVSARGVSILEWEQEAELADHLLAEQARGVDLSEFVILARSVKNQKTRKLVAALEEKGIPVLLGSGGRFYEDPRVQEMAAFLRGWVSNKNGISQAAALRAPWIGVSDEWLYECSKSREDGFFAKFFETSEHPVAKALGHLYLGGRESAADSAAGRLSRVRPGELIASLLALPGIDEELYISWVTLWHKCEEWSRSGQRFEEVVRTLSEAIEASKAGSKMEKEIPAPAAKGMLRVMTVHGSKGLQFPRVILVDFEGPSRSAGRTGDLIWDRRLGVHLLNREETGEQRKDDPENLRWKELEKSAAIAESKRVFYVALTRAQEELILLWKKGVKPPKKAQEPGYNAYLEDDWRAWVAASGVPEALPCAPAAGRLEKHPAGESVGPGPLKDFDSRLYRARHSPSEWMILDQCPLRYQRKFAQDSTWIEEESPVQRFVLQRGEQAEWLDASGAGLEEAKEEALKKSRFVAEKGERIHRAIELGDDEALTREFRSPEIGRAAVERLKAFLREEEGVIAERELGFEVPLSAREALVGMMDRLEVDEDARSIRVIDYKYTARAEPGEKLLGHYALQLKLYAWAARALLPFEPERVEGFLVHFTEAGAEILEAPGTWFESKALEAEVGRLHQMARKLAQVSPGDSPQFPTPIVGEYCRFCEWISSCPAHSRPKG
jgi:ATP-dependent exoDNAse (exonuclease V) beta subunit